MKELMPDGRQALHHGISSHGLRPGELIMYNRKTLLHCSYII